MPLIWPNAPNEGGISPQKPIVCTDHPTYRRNTHSRPANDTCTPPNRHVYHPIRTPRITTRGGEAIAEPTPLEHTVPGPLAGGAVAAPCRPPRKATGPVRRRGRAFEVRMHCSLRAVRSSTALVAVGCSKFDRTLRCARDPCPADGLAPPGCARPRRQPLVRLAPGTIRIRSCRTSRLSTPRARGPVLAAGARTRDIHGQTNPRTT